MSSGDPVAQFLDDQLLQYQQSKGGTSAASGLFDLNDERLFPGGRTASRSSFRSGRSTTAGKRGGTGTKNSTQLWKEREHKSKRSGKRSTVYSTNGDRYTGEWDADLKQGKGVFVWANGDKYEGFWHEDMRHGEGTLWLKDGQLRKVYAGSWKHDMKHGWGTFYFQNGNVYEGEWADNFRNGWGILKFANGDKYEGEWLDDQRCGQGTYIYANGDRYIGTWLNDMKEGNGSHLYVSKKRRYDGEWHEDTARCGIYYELDMDMLEDGTVVGEEENPRATLPTLELAQPEDVLAEQLDKIRQLREDKAMYAESDYDDEYAQAVQDDGEEEAYAGEEYNFN